jgi:glyoxylase-like metal-dependent hydrolase (beta-lactamase superfamily II)
LVIVPGDRIVFTGDILFSEGTPIMWAGPIENWIAACDYILGLDVEVVVPGHGPITDKQAVRNLRAYFDYVRGEALARFEAGMGWEEAAEDINLREYRGWSDPERIVANVFSLYRQWGTPTPPGAEPLLFAAMGRYHKAHCAHGESCGHGH